MRAMGEEGSVVPLIAVVLTMAVLSMVVVVGVADRLADEARAQAAADAAALAGAAAGPAAADEFARLNGAELVVFEVVSESGPTAPNHGQDHIIDDTIVVATVKIEAARATAAATSP